ncbi:ABC-F family ATP-binding cassette domain-containing protein [Aliifodinibius sp. S!AR15-10]|uniref:ABC-F family ATP-binding cassette domain-containing protein n=1 Tax=Aliifodinibius sp. S!AR15-10 TaxID=2950437 RepID=UPI00285E823D|nr:ABC-F family ATP-binding cassette domain-containing protein [Aliifodinibius sp. S!AR15-10]MDR8392594.1 ABC-F family ATP-binding cassette domain-containing protein [Aliifodinibius sp. S!AR15-10]
MTYLSTENLSKHYADKQLFEGLSFGISRGDKTALIAENGTGKTTLLRILAGKETPDEGKVMIQNEIKVGYLEQDPQLDDEKTIRSYIAESDNAMVRLIQNYHDAADAQAQDYNEETQKAFEKAAAEMEAAEAWDYEQRMEQILGKLNIHDLDQDIATLSGGQQKRVALAFAILGDPDLLILDEPTNHLDLDMIEWLEDFLIQSNMTLLMVTHDRYFLDRVCDHILELDGNKLYHHNGNYQYFLEKRAERREIERKKTHKAKQLYKQELEWMRRSPKARTTKSKSRIDDFHDIKEQADDGRVAPELRLQMDMQRMGGKILELINVSKSYGEQVILDSYDYDFDKGERIGVIGGNGVGKSTFLKILTGEEGIDSGKIRTGETIAFGHYRQEGLEFDEEQRVIDVIQEERKIIELANGNKISASQFLEHFMFTPEMQYTPVAKLSGGEKRRLALMLVLIQNPNFLILDEPTNDLDLLTLNKLEEFLMGFEGCLILVSHDRFFMDKLVEHYLVFEGDGEIRDHHGSYEEYREQRQQEELARKRAEREAKKEQGTNGQKSPSSSTSSQKLSYNEQREYNKLETLIAKLEKEKEELETQISSGELDHQELQEKSNRYNEITQEIEERTERWFELAERAS